MHSNTSTIYKTDAEQLEALRVPFPITEIKTRIQGATELSYYEAYTIQQRLLDVLGTGLSIESGQVIATESNINVETILKIEWVSGRKTSTSGWGSADILMGKTGKMVNDRRFQVPSATGLGGFDQKAWKSKAPSGRKSSAGHFQPRDFLGRTLRVQAMVSRSSWV